MNVIRNLITPPAAQTENTIALLWDRPADMEEIEGFQISVDGVRAGYTEKTDFTVTGLEPGRTYQLDVCALGKGGETGEMASLEASTRKAGAVYNIMAFGAVADGETLNTGAVQTAIDTCEPGGTVYVPRGIFVTGAVFLKSDMTLYLEEGALLLGSENPEDYPIMQYRWEGMESACFAGLVNTKDAGMEAYPGYRAASHQPQGYVDGAVRLHDITIAGKGKIDANGEALKRNEIAAGTAVRGRAVAIRNVDRLYLQDITVRQSPAWCVHLIYCKDVSINGIQVFSKCGEDGRRYKDIMNGDGIDPDSCRNLFIFHSMIASQDDCIAIKSGRNQEGRQIGIPTENVRITNCTFRSGFGVAMGSEMSGGVRNVLVQDCEFQDTYSIGSVKAPRGRGGVIENISYEFISFCNNSTEHQDCKWFRGAIYIDQFYSHEDFDPDEKQEITEETSAIRNITFRNILLDTAAGNAVYLTGLPEMPLENICLENVNAAGKYGLKAININGLKLDNVNVTSREDQDYQFHNVQ